MQAFSKTIKSNPITKGMENEQWVNHIYTHKNYLIKNSVLTEIDPVIFATERMRPILLLKQMGVDDNAIIITLMINDISLMDGFQHYQKAIYIPTPDVVNYLYDSFI